MTTSVIFCLSYDYFKWIFITLKADYFKRKHNIATDSFVPLRASDQALCNICSYDFYGMTLSTEKQ